MLLLTLIVQIIAHHILLSYMTQQDTQRRPDSIYPHISSLLKCHHYKSHFDC